MVECLNTLSLNFYLQRVHSSVTLNKKRFKLRSYMAGYFHVFLNKGRVMNTTNNVYRASSALVRIPNVFSWYLIRFPAGGVIQRLPESLGV
jgi:hypothetical protein